MKLFRLQLTSVFILFAIVNCARSQNPAYMLDVNGKSEGYNYVEFDIDMVWTNSGIAPNFEYAGGQYFFDFNPLIANGGTLTYNYAPADTSDLPANLRPRSPAISGTQLRLAVNSFPGAGFGYQFQAGDTVRIVRMRITTSANVFAHEPLNLVWRNTLPNPHTKIFAYVGSLGVDISTPATHQVSIGNDTLGGLQTVFANFYSDTRTVVSGGSVNFFDSTYGAGQAVQWEWAFPGGSPSVSALQNPEGILYDTPGVYDVTLVAWIGTESDTITKEAFITVLPECYATWSMPVFISDAGNESDSLIFGMSGNGTDGVDTCLGEVALPPPPPSGVFDCRFILASNDGVSTDIRKDTALNTDWRMTFQPSSSGYPMSFSWDSSALPSYGTFYLKDEITGSIVNVNMRLQSAYTLANSGITSLKIEHTVNQTTSIAVDSGWNMVSVPLRSADMHYMSLFPGAASEPYAYNGGYVNVTTLENGTGYWIKFGDTATYSIEGYPWLPEQMNVNEGWNLIGPFDKDIPVSSVLSEPAEILMSGFFGFSDGYFEADTLKAGKGYWVRTSASGYLYQSASAGIAVQKNGGLPDGLIRLGFTSADGRTASLYLGRASQLNGAHDLPPVPPSGIFDVRFGTDKYAEDISRTNTVNLSSPGGEIMLTLHEASGIALRVRDAIDGSILDAVLKEGMQVKIPSGLGRILIESPLTLPETYQLSQNFPNPFNPSTVIRYQIPVDGIVKLVVYDVIGREVSVPVNRFQTAGTYQIKFDASSLSSGVYFYRFTSGKFEDIKRMVVVK